MQDIVEALVVAVRRRDIMRILVGLLMFSLTWIMRFRDELVENGKYSDKNKPAHSEVWLEGDTIRVA